MSGVGGRHARVRLAGLAVLTAGVASVEAFLVAPGHLLAAQIVDATLLLVLVNLGRGDEPDQTAAAAVAAMRALALVPLMRVVAIGLPMRDWSWAVGVLVVALPLGLVALQLAPIVGIARRRLIAIRLSPSHLLAACSGAVLGLVAYIAGAPALWSGGAPAREIALALIAVTAAAAVEELVFRGVLQITFERALGAGGVLAAVALFSATYLDAGSAALVLTYALAGLVFAHSVALTGVLGGAVVGHLLLAVGAGWFWPVVLDRPDALHEPLMTIVLSIGVAAAAALAFRPSAALRARDRQP